MGEITKEDSAKRYLHTAADMGFITRIPQKWQNTKSGNILQAAPPDQNPFALTMEQTFLILKQLLTTDLDYLKGVYEATRRESSPDDELAYFRRTVRDLLSKKLRMGRSTRARASINKASKQICKWKKPLEYYSENLRAPRLEWLADLRLVTMWDQISGRVEYRPGADLLLDENMMTNDYVEAEYPRRFHKCYRDYFKEGVTEWRSFTEKERSGRLAYLLRMAGRLFSIPMIPKKFSADQFFTFSTCRLLTQENILASRPEVESDLVALTVKGALPYRYVRMISDTDTGYVVETHIT